MTYGVELLQAGTLLHGEFYVYEVVRVLGAGSFGITYLAKVCLKGALGTLQGTIYVAVKEFYMKDVNTRAGTAVDSGTESSMFQAYRDKFIREARNLAMMQHPGIVKVLEIFDANNTSYIVMEYVNGGTLDSYIKSRQRVGETESLKLIGEVARALDYMHGRKMVHLDLKPQNVMFNDSGQPVLIDFGLSKHYNADGEPESSTSIGMGTSGYAPLEQTDCTDGRMFQPTLDIYALGATLYKMLTGLVPPSAATVLNRPSLLNDKLMEAGISPSTRDLVLSAMQPLQMARPQTVQAFLDRMVSNSPEDIQDDESTLTEGWQKQSEGFTSTIGASLVGVQADRRATSSAGQYARHDDDRSCGYDFISDKSAEGLRIVGKDGKFGFIDDKGEEIIPMTRPGRKSAQSVLPFKNGLAAIGNRYFDRHNQTARWVRPWVVKACVVGIVLGLAILLILWFIDTNPWSGMHYIERLAGLKAGYTKRLFLQVVGNFGMLAAMISAFFVICVGGIGLYNIFDAFTYTRTYQADDIIKSRILARYDDHAYLMTNGLLAVMRDGKWGFIDKRGYEVIALQYDEVRVFKQGKAVVKIEGTEITVNRKGEIINKL